MSEEKLDMELVSKALVLFHKKNYTIPELSQKLEIDEYKIMQIVAYLEIYNQISLKGFHEIYRQDGGCIHLAIYGIY
jgi:hypothetical protein